MVALAFLGGLGFLLAGVGGPGGGGPGRIREIPVEKVTGARQRLVLIEARGLMIDGQGGMGEGPGFTRSLLTMLEEAAIDSTVEGVLLELDTPGGSVTDADEIHHRIKGLREKGKHVVVLMGDLCASGGLYAAVAAEKIVARPTTLTGSIGVIISGLNIASLLEQHGVKDTSVVSGPNKALLSPTQPVDPAHVALLKGIVDAMYQRFVKLVSEGRNLPSDRLATVADGRLLTADQALAAGLVDQIGHAEEALSLLKTTAGGGPFEIVRYEVEPTLLDLLKSATGRATPETALMARVFAAPRAMYLATPFASGIAP
jgi:protease-4